MELKIIDGGKPVGYLQGSMAEDLNSGLPRTNPASGQSGTWTRNILTASLALKPLGHVAS